MVNAICEECFYKGDKTEFEYKSDYCKECVCDHAMCRKCKSGISSRLNYRINNINKLLYNNIYLKNKMFVTKQ